MPACSLPLRKYVLFALLSLMDLVLTWWLLTRFQGKVYESNPIAAWWLENLGWLGLAAFKAACVLTFLVLVALIWRHRPRVGTHLLHLGCAILVLVVGYSTSLALQSEQVRTAESPPEMERFLSDINRKARQQFAGRDGYWRLRRQVAQELIQHHYTLPQAIERFALADRLKDPAWLHALPGYAGRPLEECLALQLLVEIRTLANHRFNRGERSAAERILAELQQVTRAFEQAFGHPPALPGW